MNDAAAKLLGYPLFAAGAAALVAGLALGSYWPLALGLVAMAMGALRFTRSW